jgi:hypothetical protein
MVMDRYAVKTSYRLFTDRASDVNDLARFLEIEDILATDARFEDDELIYVHSKDSFLDLFWPHGIVIF